MDLYIKRARGSSDVVNIAGKEISVNDAIKKYIEDSDHNCILYAQTGEVAGYISSYDPERGFYVSLSKKIDDQEFLASEVYRIRLIAVSNLDDPSLDICYAILIFEEPDIAPKRIIEVPRMIAEGEVNPNTNIAYNLNNFIQEYIDRFNKKAPVLTGSAFEDGEYAVYVDQTSIVGYATHFDDKNVTVELNELGNNMYNDAIAVGAADKFRINFTIVCNDNDDATKIDRIFMQMEE